MTAFLEISRRPRDKYHNLEDDETIKSKFNSRKNKDGVGMKILSWMITEELKLTKHYRMYVAVFRVDVPMTQSQPIESTQGTHRTTSAPMSPNPETDEGESSATRKSTVIRLRLPPKRSTRLTPPTPILTTDEADDLILQDTIQLSLVEQTILDELEAKQDVQKFEEHLIAKEIEKLFDGTENVANVEVDSSTLSQDDNQIYRHSTFCRPPKRSNDPHNDAHPEGENDAKRQKTSEHGTYVFGESSHGQDNESEPGPSTSSNQEQSDDFDFWMDSDATDDDELPTKKVSQELMDKMSQTVYEAKLHRVVNEIKEILVSPHPQRPTLVVQSYQRDPKAPALSMVNQDLLYLKKRSSGPEKIVMSLHKFSIVIFPDDDIEERTSRWSVARRANSSIVSITESDYKNLNKNDIEDMYLLIVHGKVDDYAETGLLWSLSIFIRSTVIWERVHDFQLGVESYQHKVNLTTPIFTFLGIEKYKMFSIVSEPVYGIIYENNKKEKRVMRHQEIHKFCDATLKRVLEGLKSYNNHVKHGYVNPSLNKDDAEYLRLFEKEIEERLKHRDQIRRWEMYVNGRPLGSRRERPE
uniref:Uncharacterized protein n=1 Tax=Tanacetum cinerariifolium TaxID=118510 RepID=A0A6L2P4Y8_TANCI|nr:hypothetical protein [Tanacetum cinerariifolium]